MRLITAISIALLLLSCSVFSGFADETAAGALKVGDETIIMADGPGRTMRSFPAVAFGKDVFLAVWQEGWQGKSGRSRIYAARMDLDGKLLDPKGIELAPCKTGIQEYPRVAFFGGVFLVVWNDLRNGKDHDVLAARVSSEGKVLDDKPISIAAGPRTQAMPDVAADDKGFMVVWHGFVDKNILPQVFTVRVGTDGTVNTPVSLIPAPSSSPRIAWSGKEHLVIYKNLPSTRVSGQNTKWLRMDRAGKVLSKRDWRKVFTASPRLSVCGISGDKGWLMAYDGGDPNWWNRGLGIQRVVVFTPDGTKEQSWDNRGRYLPKKGMPPNWLDTSYGKGAQRNIGQSANTPKVFPYGVNAVAADGKYCVAVWQRYQMGGATGMELINGDIRASRIEGCTALDKGGVAVATSSHEELNPDLAGNGTGKLLCVYEKVTDGKSSIAARTLQTR
jgi:hypothetical protein